MRTIFALSRSETNAEPSGRNANPHGVRNPLAMVATTCGCTGPVGDGNGSGEVGVVSGFADVAGPADPLAGEDTAGVVGEPVRADVPGLPLVAADCDLEVQPVASNAATTTVTTTGSSLGR